MPPSLWPLAPLSFGTRAPGPWAGTGVGWGQGLQVLGPGTCRRIPESPLAGPLSSWVLSLGPGRLMDMPHSEVSQAGWPYTRQGGHTLGGPSLSSLSLSPLLGVLSPEEGEG